MIMCKNAATDLSTRIIQVPDMAESERLSCELILNMLRSNGGAQLVFSVCWGLSLNHNAVHSSTTPIHQQVISILLVLCASNYFRSIYYCILTPISHSPQSISA